MKRITLLLLCLFPLFSTAQAPKKANVIVIKTNDSEDEAFKKMGRILLNEGFEMETLDKDFYMLVTKIKGCGYGLMKAGTVDIKIKCQIDAKNDQRTIILTGKMNSPELMTYSPTEFDSKAMVIENIGGKSSIAGASWLIMDEIAKKYEDGEIEYLIKTK